MRKLRPYLPPQAVLLAILGFSIWNSAVMTDWTDRWRDQLQQAERLAQAEEWSAAAEMLSATYTDWDSRQTYLHIVSDHAVVDDAEAMFRRAQAFAAVQEDAEFRAEVADLRDQLRLLAEMERFNLKNVL